MESMEGEHEDHEGDEGIFKKKRRLKTNLGVKREGELLRDLWPFFFFFFFPLLEILFKK